MCLCAGVFDTYVWAPPSHTPVSCHAIETDKSVCIYARFTITCIVQRKMHTVMVIRTIRTQKKRKFIMIYVRFIVLLGRRYIFYFFCCTSFCFHFKFNCMWQIPNVIALPNCCENEIIGIDLELNVPLYIWFGEYIEYSCMWIIQLF